MTDHSNNRIQLSETGQQRRDQMLTELQGVLKRRRIRRQGAKRFAAVGAGMVFVAIVTWTLLVGMNHENTVVDQSSAEPSPMDVADPNLTPNRYSELKNVVFETIDDEEMLQTLSELGCPSVLGRVRGELTVVPQTRM